MQKLPCRGLPVLCFSTQGKRVLTCRDASYLHQVVEVPASYSASHGDAFLVALMLQDA
jgi:hypothetical protein